MQKLADTSSFQALMNQTNGIPEGFPQNMDKNYTNELPMSVKELIEPGNGVVGDSRSFQLFDEYGNYRMPSGWGRGSSTTVKISSNPNGDYTTDLVILKYMQKGRHD